MDTVRRCGSVKLGCPHWAPQLHCFSKVTFLPVTWMPRSTLRQQRLNLCHWQLVLYYSTVELVYVQGYEEKTMECEFFEASGGAAAGCAVDLRKEPECAAVSRIA
jgi:hypothetical protein